MVGKSDMHSTSIKSLNIVKGMKGGMPQLVYDEQNKTGLWVLLSSPEIKVNKKYAVYDFNGIVGTVGGSLGLFVGFSVMEFMLMLIKQPIVG